VDLAAILVSLAILVMMEQVATVGIRVSPAIVDSPDHLVTQDFLVLLDTQVIAV
jgi:hypothetical protein